MLCLVAQLCPTLCDPVDCSPPGSSVHGDSPCKNTGVGWHALLQGIFWTQGLNPGLLHCRRILYHHIVIPLYLYRHVLNSNWTSWLFRNWTTNPTSLKAIRSFQNHVVINIMETHIISTSTWPLSREELLVGSAGPLECDLQESRRLPVLSPSYLVVLRWTTKQ